MYDYKDVKIALQKSCRSSLSLDLIDRLLQQDFCHAILTSL